MGFVNCIKVKAFAFKRGVRNLSYFFNVIWNYRDCDYDFMLEVEKRMMMSMYGYFKDSKIAEGDSENANKIKLCLNVLNEMEKCTDYWYDERNRKLGHIKEINVNNAPEHLKKLIEEKDKEGNRLFSYDWYEQKCWRLYNLIRFNKMQEWWN